MRLSIWVYIDSVPFSLATVRGETSLGGSESAAIGLAQALAARGHDVHIWATKLEQAGDYHGVFWHQAEQELPACLAMGAPDVFISLRMPQVFALQIPAKLNILWNQDLLALPDKGAGIMGLLAQVDHVAFVSAFHRKQWCDLQPMLAPMAWVTTNAIDPALLPAQPVEKVPHRFIYISRPERALKPLLQMWPRIRERIPDATLAICRYESMYDGEGSNVARMCASFDQMTAQVAQKVGGIEVLGHLGKRELYAEIARAQLMLYPGISDFAETSCVAAIEAQANGTPLIASWKGALPETLHPDAGILLDGDASTPEYQARFVDAVVSLCDDPRRYASMQAAGRAHVLPTYTFEALAESWETFLLETFRARYEANKVKVLRQLMHWDNHVAARRVAQDILSAPDAPGECSSDDPVNREASAALTLCNRVIAGEDHTPESYAQFAIQDVLKEVALNGRIHLAADVIEADQPTRILDVACGNGSMAILLAQRLPQARIDALDYSEGVLALGRAAAVEAGVADRITFRQAGWQEITGPGGSAGLYDAVFCGEFLEHVEFPEQLIDRLERHCKPGGVVVLTTPQGPFAELLEDIEGRKRGHLHSFHLQDIARLFEQKRAFRWRHIGIGSSPRGSACGYWLVAFQPGGGPAQGVDYDRLILTERPFQRLAVSMIAKDGAEYLQKCLASVARIADRIVIYDAGSTDDTVRIAQKFRAEVVPHEWPHHFAEARNRSLSHVEHWADWVLWIDCDEYLDVPVAVRKYLTGAGPFTGYALHQYHLMVDAANFFDKPVRLFRTRRGIQFFGHVHEQPEQTPDEGIVPALEITDVQVVHLGYQVDAVRRAKMLERNLDLLKAEITSPAPRRLASVLVLRDYVNLAQHEREQAGAMTPKVIRYLRNAVALFQREFADPADKYHGLAFPFYQTALAALGQGIEVAWAFGAAPGKLQGKPVPEKFRVADPGEMRRLVDFKVARWTDQLTGAPLDCEPFVSRNDDGGWGLPAHVTADEAYAVPV